MPSPHKRVGIFNPEDENDMEEILKLLDCSDIEFSSDDDDELAEIQNRKSNQPGGESNSDTDNDEDIDHSVPAPSASGDQSTAPASNSRGRTFWMKKPFPKKPDPPGAVERADVLIVDRVRDAASASVIALPSTAEPYVVSRLKSRIDQLAAFIAAFGHPLMASVVLPHVKATDRLPRVVLADTLLEVPLFNGIIALTSTATAGAGPHAVGRETHGEITLMVTCDLALQPGRLFVVMDRISGLCFFVDTGAEVSILPASKEGCSSEKRGPTLHAANCASIITYGLWSLTLDLRLRRRFRRVVIVADVSRLILGPDFLSHFDLDMSFCDARFPRTRRCKGASHNLLIGPYCGVHKRPKSATILLNGREGVASLEHLKPAYLETLPHELQADVANVSNNGYNVMTTSHALATRPFCHVWVAAPVSTNAAA
ncbi:hypothetical protein HPB50_017654 [Hyalomma asiaticum]|uniref:Uncharacterized protein n=1 Tax=Hyalomma asiaticum TaxID=266040 RepID=A0ACB7RP92_HYAAI|nr:hypothetical protein HPB50_017654 [Hyalomma asiaticum]